VFFNIYFPSTKKTNKKLGVSQISGSDGTATNIGYISVCRKFCAGG
jgi:hypothetical protein